MRVKRKSAIRACVITGIAIAASAITATVSVLPANASVSGKAAAHSSAPVSNVHVGQVLAQIPKSGNKCSSKPLTTPVHVSVKSTAAHPNAYVSVSLDSKCRLVVSKIAYGMGTANTAGTSASAASSAATQATAAPAAVTAASSVCDRHTQALLSEKSGFTVVGTVGSGLHYSQYCSWGNIISASAGETTYTSVAGIATGYGFFNDFFGLDSVTTARAISSATFNMVYIPVTSLQAQGQLTVKNTSYSDGAIYANCSWTSSISADTGGDTFVCQVVRDA